MRVLTVTVRRSAYIVSGLPRGRGRGWGRGGKGRRVGVWGEGWGNDLCRCGLGRAGPLGVLCTMGSHGRCPGLGLGPRPPPRARRRGGGPAPARSRGATRGAARRRGRSRRRACPRGAAPHPGASPRSSPSAGATPRPSGPGPGRGPSPAGGRWSSRPGASGAPSGRRAALRRRRRSLAPSVGAPAACGGGPGRARPWERARERAGVVVALRVPLRRLLDGSQPPHVVPHRAHRGRAGIRVAEVGRLDEVEALAAAAVEP